MCARMERFIGATATVVTVATTTPHNGASRKDIQSAAMRIHEFRTCWTRIDYPSVIARNARV